MVLELLKEGECTLRQIVQRVPAPSDSIIQTLYTLAEQQKIVAGDNSTFSLPDRGSKK
jgi:predicted transcriptional regulator